VDIFKLNRKVLNEMLPLHEAWAGGIKLESSAAYGLRVYTNNQSLAMHIDHHDKHVISSIMHVDHDLDEPWPIVIIGYDGVTAECNLKPGEMLFYESVKCVHGRPRRMKGRWYSSFFVHYRPAEMSISSTDAIAVVGERHRKRLRIDRSSPQMYRQGTGFIHSSCEHEWCGIAPVPLANDDAIQLDEAALQPVKFHTSARLDYDMEVKNRRLHYDLNEKSERKDTGRIGSVQASFKNNYKDGVDILWIPEDPLAPHSYVFKHLKLGSSPRIITFPGHILQARFKNELLNVFEIRNSPLHQQLVVTSPTQEL